MSFFAKTLEFKNRSGETSGVGIIEEFGLRYYDFTLLTGTNGSAISNGNAGLVEQLGLGSDATIINTPVVRDLTVNGETVKSLHDESTNCVNMNETGATFLNDDFEIYLIVQLQDGNPSSSQNLLGGIKPTNIGINVFLQADGKLGVAYGTTSGVLAWVTTSAVFVNGVNPIHIIRIRMAFGSSVKIFKDGVEQAGGFTLGNINSPTPSEAATDFTTNIYIGSLNNNGTPNGVGGVASVVKCLFTELQSITTPAFQMPAIQEELFKFTWDDWQSKEIHVTSGNASSTRSTLISTLFNGGSLPTISPTTATGITGAIHICNTSNISNASSWDRLTFETTDIDTAIWSHKCYRGYTNQTANNKLLIINNGHVSEVAAQYELLMTTALGYGYDVLYTSMPVVGDNTETSAKVTSTSSTGHNQMLSNGLDTVSYNPIELFLFDKISAVNHLNASYDEIYMTGNSGGAWTTALCAAVDERIKISIPNRGIELRNFKYRETAIDYEQGGMPDYGWTAAIAGNVSCGSRRYTDFTNITYFDILALGTTSGRIVQRHSHFNDTCCFVGSTSLIWQDTLKTLAGTLGGEFHNIIDFNTARATHQFSAYDINNIFHLLGDL